MNNSHTREGHRTTWRQVAAHHTSATRMATWRATYSHLKRCVQPSQMGCTAISSHAGCLDEGRKPGRAQGCCGGTITCTGAGRSARISGRRPFIQTSRSTSTCSCRAFTTCAASSNPSPDTSTTCPPCHTHVKPLRSSTSIRYVKQPWCKWFGTFRLGGGMDFDLAKLRRVLMTDATQNGHHVFPFVKALRERER